MYFKQFYLGCLAHASYMIGSEGEAAVVDPQRDVDIYLEEARREGLAIRHVIETHLHADFVSGHRELAERTGARIYFGWKAGAKFDYVAVRDGDQVTMGKVQLRFLETPGHTPESICVLISEGEGSSPAEAILTGDTLFIGDVGRPDLLGAVMSAENLAGMLYDSLHEKILRLPDSVKVYPAHGAGSMCGRNISDERSSTIGQERRFNYALQPMTREDFVRMMTVDLPERPAYFAMDAELNRSGPPLLDNLSGPAVMSADGVRKRLEQGSVVLDIRPSAKYGTGHIIGSLNIGLGGQFASWAGTLVGSETSIIFVTEDEEQVREAHTRLARVGLEKVVGYLGGGVLEWHRAGLPFHTIEQISVEELHQRIQEGKTGQLLDVRRPGEWSACHIACALNIPLHQLSGSVAPLNPKEPVTVICAGGYRSSIGTSLLERHGFEQITNVVGGMSAWINAQLPIIK